MLEVVFADGVTLREVIPSGEALKVPYMDSIITICMEILPRIDSKVSNIRIIKGFISRASLFKDEADKNKKVSREDLLHSKARALELTFDNYDYLSALALSKFLFEDINDNIHIIIKDKSLLFLRKQKDKRVIRDIGNSRSVILK